MIKFKIYHVWYRTNKRGENYKVLETLNDAFPYSYGLKDEFTSFDAAIAYMKENLDIFKYDSFTIIPEIFITTNADGAIDDN